MTTSSSFYQETNPTPTLMVTANSIIATLSEDAAAIAAAGSVTGAALAAYVLTLPTTLPSTSGLLWNDNGSLAIS